MTLSEYFELEASAVEGQSLKGEKERWKKMKKNKNPDSVGHFLVLKLEIFISVHAPAKLS